MKPEKNYFEAITE